MGPIQTQSGEDRCEEFVERTEFIKSLEKRDVRSKMLEFIKLLETRSWSEEPIYHYAQSEHAIYDQRYLLRSIHGGKRSATRCMAAEPVSKARARRGGRRASGRRSTAATRRAGRQPLAAISQRTWRLGKSTPTNGPASVPKSVGVQVGHERPDHSQGCCPCG